LQSIFTYAGDSGSFLRDNSLNWHCPGFCHISEDEAEIINSPLLGRLPMLGQKGFFKTGK